MRRLAPWPLVVLALLTATPAQPAEIGVVTLVDEGTRLLRGTTWHRFEPGTAVEDGDVLEANERAQIYVELTSGTRASLVGAGAIYLEAQPSKTASPATGPMGVEVQDAWLKVAAKPPGVRLATRVADIVVVDGIIVMRTRGPALDLFVESGEAELIERSASGAKAQARELNSGDYWSKLPGAAFATAVRPPRAFVDAMPRHYFDALPQLQDKVKARPAPVAGREISYAEAEPWLAGRDRVAFERRFIGRLRDRGFRNDATPHLARYPSWDRRVNPQKYAPKPSPAVAPSR